VRKEDTQIQEQCCCGVEAPSTTWDCSNRGSSAAACGADAYRWVGSRAYCCICCRQSRHEATHPQTPRPHPASHCCSGCSHQAVFWTTHPSKSMYSVNLNSIQAACGSSGTKVDGEEEGRACLLLRLVQILGHRGTTRGQMSPLMPADFHYRQLYFEFVYVHGARTHSLCRMTAYA
jgi:hypothetical protein